MEPTDPANSATPTNVTCTEDPLAFARSKQAAATLPSIETASRQDSLPFNCLKNMSDTDLPEELLSKAGSNLSRCGSTTSRIPTKTGSSVDRPTHRRRLSEELRQDSSTLKTPTPAGGNRERDSAAASKRTFDYSWALTLLQNTESQGTNAEELTADDADALVERIQNNRTLWWDILQSVDEQVERLEDDITSYQASRDKYFNQAQEYCQQVLNLKGKGEATRNPDDLAAFEDLQAKFNDFRQRTRLELDERDQSLAEQVNCNLEVEDEVLVLQRDLDTAQNDLAAVRNALDAAEQDCDFAQNVLDQSQADTCPQSQTQKAFDVDNFFKKPAIPGRTTRDPSMRDNPLRPRARSHSRHREDHSRPHSRYCEDRSLPRCAQASSTPGAASSAYSTKLDRRFPDPEIFTGADSSKYCMWRSKMKAKLRASYDHDKDVQTLLDYLHSRTTGQAWQVIDNHNIDKKAPWLSMQEAWSALDGMYQSRDKEAKAEMEFTLLTQDPGQDYSKFMVALKDVAARADHQIKANDVWMKLNEALQKKSAHLCFKTFTKLDDFCLDQELAYHAMKMLRPKAPAGASKDDFSLGRGRGRGRGNNPPDCRTQSAPPGIIRYLPCKYQNLPKACDPIEAACICTNNLCFGCRESGHGAGDPSCIFAKSKGCYAYADVPYEMTAEQGNAYMKKNGGTVTQPTFGSTSNNAISFNAIAEGQFDDSHALPPPETQARITDTKSLIDTGASSSFVSSNFVRAHKIPTITLHYVTHIHNYDTVLGLSWLTTHNPTIDFADCTIHFNKAHCLLNCLHTHKPCLISVDGRGHSYTHEPPKTHSDLDIETVSAYAFLMMTKNKKNEVGVLWPEDLDPKKGHVQSFAMTPEDFEKFMNSQTKTDPLSKLPECYHEFIDVFKHKTDFELPPHQSVDHGINLKPGKEPPYKKGFPMNPEQLKALKKYIDEELAKGTIEESKSSCASPVLIVCKPNGGLRICVDYCALNELTIKDRYPIPLIKETLEQLSKAKYYTKLDIVAAFNNLRIREGDEWMTAFITQYGLYQYKVMPFGLCNGPASWQRYMNNIMQEYLDEFCTVYLDDVLIYSETLEEHQGHVRKVLLKLRDAGLPVDIEKCEFHVQEVKYLGLIITPDGLKMDPVKVEAVQTWETPRSVRDIQAFLGFANFYCKFIRGFSLIAAPLTAQTKKDHTFQWTPECDKAFESLKFQFTSAPILAHYDPDCETWMETDASNYVVAGVLSQMHLGPDGKDLLRPVAYFSKRMVLAECNYDTYDKELLAIVRCFEEWRPELMPVFNNVLSDHRNLQWFMETKLLNARQAYLPAGTGDLRIVNRERVIFKKDNTDTAISLAAVFATAEGASVGTAPALVTNPFAALADIEDNDTKEGGVKLPASTHNDSSLSDDDDDDELPLLQDALRDAYQQGVIQQEMKHCHQELADGKVPQFMKTHCIEPSDCAFVKGMLIVNGRLYIPDHLNMRTRCIREYHDTPLAGHQGASCTFDLLSCVVFWPKMWEDVSRYLRNCHTCRRANASRLKQQGTLASNAVPQHAWHEITVDYIVELPSSKSSITDQKFSNVLTITNRLTKMVYFIPTNNMTPEHCARLFHDRVFALHGLPSKIISDRGSQFTSKFFERLCVVLGIKRNMSSAFHPQTDGQSEKTNQALEQYLYCFCGYLQDDWVDWLPTAQFALNNHANATTKVSPHFANFGRHPRMSFLLDLPQPEAPLGQRVLIDKADAFAWHMSEVWSQMTSEITLSQAKQAHYEDSAPAPVYQPGQLVWLDSQHIKTKRLSKKLDHKNEGPFEIIAPVG
ncbi:hypothetical protein Q7P35_005168 [Cladosporium inversicolor]